MFNNNYNNSPFSDFSHTNGQRQYSRSNGGNYSRGNKFNTDQKKHSGAKFIQKDEKTFIVSAWNYSRSRGMITLYARPWSKSQITESKTGKRWINLFVTITFRKTGNILKTSALYDIHGKRLFVKDLNMIATSRGKGGYFGKHM